MPPTIETLMEQAPAVTEDVLALVDQMLGSDGLASQNNYRFSDQQLDFARRAAIALCSYDEDQQKTGIGMLEAATGLGKTLGYLAALFAYAAVTDERCAVSTHSRQLQRQMLDKDAVAVQEWIETLTGKSLFVARRVGKQNYIAMGKVQELIEALPKGRSKDEQKAYGDIHEFLTLALAWLPTGSGVLDDFLQEHGIDLPDGVSPSQLTLDQHASEEDAAHYHIDTANSKRADIVIINHSLLVLHAYRWGAILDEQGDDGRPLRAIVVDEAHKLPGVAESVLSDSLSLVRFTQISRKIADHLSHDKEWETLAGHTDRLRQFLYEKHEKSQGRYASARHIDGLGEHLKTLSDEASLAGNRLVQLLHKDLLNKEISKEQRTLYAEALDHCHDAIRLSRALEHPASGTPIISWSPVKEYPSLSIGAPDAGQTLSRLWAPLSQDDEVNETKALLPPRPILSSIVLTSATLGAPGEPLPKAFDPLSRQLGINRHPGADGLPIHNVQTDVMVRHAPRTFGSMSFVLPDPSIPSPSKKFRRGDVTVIETDPDWLAYSAGMLREAASEGERVLALTLSWRDTEALSKALYDIAPSLNIITHQRGEPLRAMLSRFEAHADAILITPSGWEGVDAPGLVKNLMIHRIPFPPPNTDVDYRLRLHLSDKGYGADVVEKIVNQRAQEAVRQQLAQGLGRGIRAVDDTCKVWIADTRFPLPMAWRSSFDPEIDARMDDILGRFYNRRLLDAIPSRFHERFDEAVLWLQEKKQNRLYEPEID